MDGEMSRSRKRSVDQIQIVCVHCLRSDEPTQRAFLTIHKWLFYRLLCSKVNDLIQNREKTETQRIRGIHQNIIMILSVRLVTIDETMQSTFIRRCCVSWELTTRVCRGWLLIHSRSQKKNVLRDVEHSNHSISPQWQFKQNAVRHQPTRSELEHGTSQHTHTLCTRQTTTNKIG